MAKPYHRCVKVRTYPRGRSVLEPDDVVELRRRDLDDRRVLERGHAVDRARAGSGRPRPAPTTSLFSIRSPGRAELELRAARLSTYQDSSFSLVELEAQRLAGRDEEDLAGVVARSSPRSARGPTASRPSRARTRTGRARRGSERSSDRARPRAARTYHRATHESPATPGAPRGTRSPRAGPSAC